MEILTQREKNSREQDFLQNHNISREDIITTSYDIPIILRNSLNLDNAPDSLLGHPCLWLPEDVRAIEGDEPLEVYAVRIFLILEAYGFFSSSNSMWTDVILNGIGLDSLENSDEVRSKIKSPAVREQLNIADVHLKSLLPEFRQAAASTVDSLNKLNRQTTDQYRQVFLDEIAKEVGAAQVQQSLKTIRQISTDSLITEGEKWSKILNEVEGSFYPGYRRAAKERYIKEYLSDTSILEASGDIEAVISAAKQEAVSDYRKLVNDLDNIYSENTDDDRLKNYLKRIIDASKPVA